MTTPLRSLVLLYLVGIAACEYDASDRCGPHQVEITNDRCACVEGYVPGARGCVPCDDNEQERSGECVCVDGYARAAPAAACEALPGGLGTECDDAKPCRSQDFPECHVTETQGGYCTTTGCKTSTDCEGGYMCMKDGASSYCRRPPVGYGQKCKSQDDCAAGDATFCEMLQSHVCIVPCSANNTTVCFEGEQCCDFSQFNAGTVCTPAAACSAPGIPLGGP